MFCQKFLEKGNFPKQPPAGLAIHRQAESDLSCLCTDLNGPFISNIWTGHSEDIQHKHVDKRDQYRDTKESVRHLDSLCLGQRELIYCEAQMKWSRMLLFFYFCYSMQTEVILTVLSVFHHTQHSVCFAYCGIKQFINSTKLCLAYCKLALPYKKPMDFHCYNLHYLNRFIMLIAPNYMVESTLK